jgi:4-hydroxy 2-oxovalerate aldolase
LKCIRDTIEPLRANLNWGFDIPYMITGVLNQHPRPAMQFNASADRGDIVKFFDMMIEEE